MLGRYGRGDRPSSRRNAIRPRPWRAAAAGLALALAAAGCAAGRPAASPSPAPLTTLLDRDPTEDEVRAAGADYLRAVRAEVVSITVEDHHVGLYVRGTPEWTLDQFVEHLPVAAEAARAMIARWPTVASVDICGDGPWLPRDEYDDFASASRVQVFRDRLDRLPPRFTTPAEVMRAGGTDRVLDYYLDPKIVTESAAYREQRRANVGKTTPSR